MIAQLKITLTTPAFCPNPASELARILRDLAERIEHGNTSVELTDADGAKVGEFSIEENQT